MDEIDKIIDQVLNPGFELVKTFEEGDYICHVNTYLTHPMWFHATDTDVENYSGKNGYYIKDDNKS